MAKCIRCGRFGMGVIHSAVKLKDKNMICSKCYKELGGSPLKDMTTASLLYTYDDIKDGFDAMYERDHASRVAQEAAALGVSYKQYKQLTDAAATDMESNILAMICAILRDEDRDPDQIDVSLGDNGSLLLMLDGVIFIRYKADAGVKWIIFENESPEKIRIAGPGRLNSYAARIVQAYDSADT